MMERIENSKMSKKIIDILSNRKVKYIIGTVLLSGIGIALPRIFHILAGSSAGSVFLPIHIAVLIAALTFGVTSAAIVGGSSVIFSYLLTGMPAIARLPYMLIELLIYAIILGILNKKYNRYMSLIATMIVGRIIYAGVLFASTNIFGLSAYGISVMGSVKLGIPGMILQLIIVPIIAKVIKERVKL